MRSTTTTARRRTCAAKPAALRPLLAAPCSHCCAACRGSGAGARPRRQERGDALAAPRRRHGRAVAGRVRAEEGEGPQREGQSCATVPLVGRREPDRATVSAGGKTALIWACGPTGHPQSAAIVKLLLESGADINAPDASECLPGPTRRSSCASDDVCLLTAAGCLGQMGGLRCTTSLTTGGWMSYTYSSTRARTSTSRAPSVSAHRSPALRSLCTEAGRWAQGATLRCGWRRTRTTPGWWRCCWRRAPTRTC